MAARSPEELDRLFAEGLNAGDLDALTALYEPNAALTAQPGHVVTGTHAIREALRQFLAADVKILAQTGDIALTSARWELAGTAPDGTPVKMAGHSAEVSRRQADGTWRFVIDTPWGLECNA